MFRLSIILALFLLLAGCAAPTLKQTEINDSAIQNEERLQKKLVDQERYKLKQRLKRIESQLTPQVTSLCSYLSDGDKTGCYFPVELDESSAVNAYTNGKKVVIHKGIMRLLDNDAELAVVVGHEYAHAMLLHINKKKTNMFIGLFFDALITGLTGVDTQAAFSKVGAKAYSKDFESEADYAGLYLAYRAGYDITEASNVWRKMAVENSSSIIQKYGASHPSSPKRFIAQDHTYKEIIDKVKTGQQLLPDKLVKIANKDNPEIKTDTVNTSVVKQAEIKLASKPKKNRSFGKYSIKAENFISDYGCLSPDGSKAVGDMTSQQSGTEIYEFICQEEKIMRVDCDFAVCHIKKFL